MLCKILSLATTVVLLAHIIVNRRPEQSYDLFFGRANTYQHFKQGKYSMTRYTGFDYQADCKKIKQQS